MQWKRARRSDNVVSGGSGGGGRGGKGLTLGAVVLVVAFGLITGQDPMQILGQLAVQMETPATSNNSAPVANNEQTDFVRAILGDTEDTWRQLFQQAGREYQDPKLVLFNASVRSACGMASSASGPFYCPADRQVYLDVSFFRELAQRYAAAGDFAQAYVIAHEVGHHVQNQLGISGKVDQMRGRVSKTEYNALSVRLELQADCFAGVWAHHAQSARQILEKGDVEEAMNAAAKIGDDALQRAAGGAVVPDSFTHGTSAQRQRWFNNGLQNGSVKGCDTFAARSL